MDLASIPVDLPLFVDETCVSVIETVSFITFGTFCGSRRLVVRVVRLFRWFRSGCSGFSGGFVLVVPVLSVVPVVPVVSFRRFRFGVSGFSTCLKKITRNCKRRNDAKLPNSLKDRKEESHAKP